jgi:hypothetical protein
MHTAGFYFGKIMLKYEHKTLMFSKPSNSLCLDKNRKYKYSFFVYTLQYGWLFMYTYSMDEW